VHDFLAGGQARARVPLVTVGLIVEIVNFVTNAASLRFFESESVSSTSVERQVESS
jgi:hypothetical protein